jgi:hypothetical protein
MTQDSMFFLKSADSYIRNISCGNDFLLMFSYLPALINNNTCKGAEFNPGKFIVS